MTTFQIHYRLKDYQLADAFRPKPYWGLKRYLVKSEDVGTEDIKEIYAMALDSPPADRYGLLFVRELPDGEKMWGPEADKFKPARAIAQPDAGEKA